MASTDPTASSTFERVAIDLTHKPFPELAAGIRAKGRIDKILKRWRVLSLKAMPHLDALTLEEFEDTVLEILLAAADAMHSADPLKLSGVIETGPQHGIDRFVQKYSLLDLFEEVRILRCVVVIGLAEEMGRPLEVDEAATFHAIFDIVIQQGVMALVQRQTEEASKIQTATQETNQKLEESVARQGELLEKAKLAEQELRDSEAETSRLAAIVESSDDAIISKDLKGIIATWNGGAQKLFGYTADEAVGKPISILIPEDYIDEEPHILARIARGESITHYETLRRTKDGNLLNISLTVSPIRDHCGRVVGASKIARNITERVGMENRIKQQAEALASEARSKDEFLAMLSHELRNPLAPIRSAVHVLRGQDELGGVNALQRKAHDIIERQVANLTKLVSDLLEVSRVISGTIRLNSEVVDLSEIVEHAVETARPLFADRNHELMLDLCERGVYVNGDATRLEEVFVNLLNNAAKYTPDGGLIEVHCDHASATSYAEVRIRDNGVGIQTDLLPRVFELFTQAERSLARSEGGLGIGLSLARRLIELHGGTIKAFSPPEGREVGSEFVVTLPVAPSPSPPEPEESADDDTQTEGVRVLLVDDNADLVAMLSASLRLKGLRVKVAYAGQEALATALRWRPDVVLLDIGLPGMDGYEVARRLQVDGTPGKAGAKMRLIALTGYGRETDIALARDAGFDAHLVKPVDFDELIKLISAVESSPAVELV